MSAALDAPPKPASKFGRLLFPAFAIVLALVAMFAGYYIVSNGIIKVPALGYPQKEDEHSLPEVAFLPLEPMVINMPSAGEGRYLRFVAQLELAPGRRAEVEAVMPRITDAMNSYLRLLRPSDLSDAPALMRTKAQLLRRIRLSTPEGAVINLLITEMVMN